MVTTDQEIRETDGILTSNVTYYGLSTDDKPTDGVGNGSCFIEIDTGDAYFYDAEGGAWHAV